MSRTQQVKRKIIMSVLPVFIPPTLLTLLAVFALSGVSEPIEPPATETKAVEYQEVCSVLGVPWDIIMLVDTQKAQENKDSDIENYNPLETALEFTVLKEQVYTIAEEASVNENDEEVTVQSKTLTDSVEYKGKQEILAYVGINEVENITSTSLKSLVEETAAEKCSDTVSYEVSFLCESDIENVLGTVFHFSEEEIQNIMELHTSRYIILLYNGSDTISSIQIGDFTEVEGTVWQFLKDIGFNDIGAAATMGNMKIESSFNPAANHNNLYYGLCQWGGGRWSGNAISLSYYAIQYGTEWYDLEMQLNYFALECHSSFSSVYSQMQSATDLIYATDYFCCFYEICPGELGNWANSIIDSKAYQGLADRRAYAQAYYEKYAEGR